MQTNKWIAASIFSLFCFEATAQQDCWIELSELPSDTRAIKKIDKVVECTAKQGVVLEGLKSTIGEAQKARDEAVTASNSSLAISQEVQASVKLLAEVAKQNDLIIRSLEKFINPWEIASENLYEIASKINEAHKGQDNHLTKNFEYAIMRNGDLRTLNISTWNQGTRIMTNTYLTGDSSLSGAGLRRGGSVWLFETKDPTDDDGFVDHRDKVCGPPNRLRHYYFYIDATINNDTHPIITTSSNGCTIEGPVYKRKRLFK